MPQSQDLMGFGMDPFSSGLLGNDPQALAGTGTTQGTAAAILSHLVEVTGASSNTGAILPASAHIGTPFYVASVGGTAAKIYVPSTHTLNGTTNGGATFSAAGLLIFIQTSRGKWWVTGTATATVA